MESDDDRLIQLRQQNFQLFKYKPIAPTEQNPNYNNQLGFHQSRAQVRIITGANRSGKTHSVLCELAAVALGAPYPWWFNWEQQLDAPLTIWIVIDQFPRNPAEDARVRKLYLGERYMTRDKRWVWAAPLIPPEMIHWQLPDYSEVTLKDGTTISMKSSEQKILAFGSRNVDFIVVDEPTRDDIWGELVSRMVAVPHARLVHGLTDIYDTTEYLDNMLENPAVDRFNFTTAGQPHTDAVHAAKTFQFHTREQRMVREGGMRQSEVLRLYPYVEKWVDPVTMRELKNFQGGTGNWIKPFPIPKTWTRYAVHDPGVKVAATVWFAVAPNQDVFAYRCVHHRNAGGNVQWILDTLNRANDGDEIYTWYMDPVAAEHTPRTYVYASTHSTIDVYRRYSDRFGIRWVKGPPHLRNYRVKSRIDALTAYLNPQDNSVPMMYFFDVNDGLAPERGIDGMPALKNEFRKYKKDSKTGEPKKEHRDAIYGCEAAAVIPFRYQGVQSSPQGWVRFRRDPVEEFMNGASGMPEGWREEP